jgi:phenylalanyl-tRNA synthetase beta chain
MDRDEIFVRRGRAGERLVTLDGVERALGTEILLITDGENPIGVAGVMGGESTQVTSQTKRVLLESAWFNPRVVRGSRRSLRLDTEASYRFERECDPGNTVTALERACRLIEESGAGRPQVACVDMLSSTELVAPKTVILRTKQANRVMGTMLAADDLAELLSRLGLDAFVSGTDLTFTVPTFRRDLREEVDLIEEAARVYGYDAIGGNEGRHNSIFAEIAPLDRRNEELCERLSARGFAEVVTTSFMDPGDPRRFEWRTDDPRSRPVLLDNPLTAAQSVMRTSLLPGMLRVVERNAAAGIEGIRIFELDKVFLPRGEGEGLPDEPRRLTALLCRKAGPIQWQDSQRDTDFFDMKGEAESVIEWLGAASEMTFERSLVDEPDHYFNWILKNRVVGTCGLIPRRICARFGIDDPVFFFDIEIDAFLPGGGGRAVFNRISQFPAVKRDLSVIASEAIRWEDIRNVVKKRTKHLESVRLFDYYRGDRLGKGRRGYAFRLTFRSSEGTLDDATVDVVIDKVLAGLQEELQVVLRTE